MVNAFWLDRDLERGARWLVDAHVTSSVFEGSMVLTTAVQLNGSRDDSLYFTHPQHPLTRWAATAFGNWLYLRSYVEAAHREWQYRWDHSHTERHACWATVETIDVGTVRALDWPNDTRNDPPQLTGRWKSADYVDAYRYYYANEKRHLFTWSKDRSAPHWIDEYTVDHEPEPTKTR